MSPREFRHLRGGKFSQYEGGHRVPALAWWPGKVQPGTTSDALILGFDLFPTFTDIAGIAEDNPDKLDGTSAKDHILQRKDFPDRDIHSRSFPSPAAGAPNFCQSTLPG